MMNISTLRNTMQNWLIQNPGLGMQQGQILYERWVVEQLVVYLEGIIEHGSFEGAGLTPPVEAVRRLAMSYGVNLG